MKKTYSLLIALLAAATPLLGQTNPCNDPVYLRLSAIDLDDMSDREFEVFSRMSEACTQFLIANAGPVDGPDKENVDGGEVRLYSVKGFSFRPHFSSTYWYLDDSRFLIDDAYGGGFGFAFGWGFSELVTLVLNIDGSSMDSDFRSDLHFGHVDLGIRFTFAGTQRRFKPFANVALTGFGGHHNDFYRPGGGYKRFSTVGGGGLTLGGGFQHFFSTKVALDLALDLTIGEASYFEVGGIPFDRNRDSFSSRFGIGIAWYPWN